MNVRISVLGALSLIVFGGAVTLSSLSRAEVRRPIGATLEGAVARPAEGAEWFLVAAPPSFWGLTDYPILSIDMISSTMGMGVSGQGFLRYESGSWDIQEVTWTLPSALSMASVSDGWAVGQNGRLAHYADGAWQVMTSPVTVDLLAVDMLSETDGWAVGDNGTILHYADNSWQIVTSPITLTELMALDMVSGTDGWAVGYQGDILHYTGSSWQTVSSPTTDNLHSVSMVSSSDGWIVGDVILHYVDGEWHEVSNPMHDCHAGNVLLSVDMVSGTDGWAGGFCGTIMQYANGDGLLSLPFSSYLPRTSTVGLW